MAWAHIHPVDNTVEGDNEGLGALEASYREPQDGRTLAALLATFRAYQVRRRILSTRGGNYAGLAADSRLK